MCSYESGIMQLNEHENFAWVKKKDFGKYDFVEEMATFYLYFNFKSQIINSIKFFYLQKIFPVISCMYEI